MFVVAVPAGLVLSFLGINASQVNPRASMFSDRYLPMYVAVACVIVAGALLAVIMYLRNRHTRDTSSTRITWLNSADTSQLLAVDD